MDEPEEIRKPGWGHPLVLLFWALVAAHAGLLLWLAWMWLQLE